MVIKCPKCNHFVSDMAPTCPHCGAILKEEVSSHEISNVEEQIKGSIYNEDNSIDIPQSNQYEQSKMVEQPDSDQVGEQQVEIPQKETKLMTNLSEDKPEIVPPISGNSAPSYSAPVAPPPDSVAYQQVNKGNGTLIAIIVLLAIMICGVVGYLYYDNVYLPEKIDREAPRYFTMANVVVLRSSRAAGADFNKVASLPYGTELITYEIDSEWARVKVNSQSGDKQEGYVATSYIMEKKDFFLLNSIFGNQDSKETIITTKCRIALLNYFKEKQYIGKIDPQLRIDAGISVSPNSYNQWQVFTKPKDAKPNSVLFKRLYNKNSQFTDFAVLITNSITKERRLLYFYFDDDETPHLLEEQRAPSDGYIVDANYEYDFYSDSRELSIRYSY